MNFGIIYKLRDKKNWWVDVVFYFVISLLVALVICYLIFGIQISIQNKKIGDLKIALTTVGTDEQKSQEKIVFLYQKKINDYAQLIKNHQIASNAFSFLEKYTLPNVWFSKFDLDEKQATVSLSGQADDMQTLSNQVSILEEKENVKKIDLLNSTQNTAGKIDFNLNLSLDPKMFAFDLATLAALQSANLPKENPVTTPETTPQTTPAITPETTQETTPAVTQEANPQKSSAKFITSFDISLDSEIAGIIDQEKHTITLNVPSGTYVKDLSPSITVSENATVSPASDVLQDFTDPVVYTVTAEDLSMQNYTVVVNVAKAVEKKSAKNQSLIILLIILFVVMIFAVIFGIFVFLSRRKKSIFKDANS